MRERKLIDEGTPCGVDYTDKSIQSVNDAVKKGLVRCSNLEQCKKISKAENIQCSLKMAQMMAKYTIESRNKIQITIENEKQEFLKSCPQNKFWICRNGQWSIIEGKENVLDDIVAFAYVIIDLKHDDRRPFTDDGKKLPEIQSEDATYNALLDLTDMRRELF